MYQCMIVGILCIHYVCVCVFVCARMCTNAHLCSYCMRAIVSYTCWRKGNWQTTVHTSMCRPPHSALPRSASGGKHVGRLCMREVCALFGEGGMGGIPSWFGPRWVSLVHKQMAVAYNETYCHPHTYGASKPWPPPRRRPQIDSAACWGIRQSFRKFG